MRTFRYGMRLRGYAPMCQPMKGLVRVEDGCVVNDRNYHNILFYVRKLSDKELRDYELDYLGIY